MTIIAFTKTDMTVSIISARCVSSSEHHSASYSVAPSRRILSVSHWQHIETGIVKWADSWIVSRQKLCWYLNAGVSNVRPAGQTRPGFSGPWDDFANDKNKLQFFNWRNCCFKCVHWMLQKHFCYANQLSKKARGGQTFGWMECFGDLPH